MLYRDGDLGDQDEKEMTDVLFQNATIDREKFHSLPRGEALTKQQDYQFMSHAWERVVPIVRQYKSKIMQAVSELEISRRVSGERIRQIINAR